MLDTSTVIGLIPSFIVRIRSEPTIAPLVTCLLVSTPRAVMSTEKEVRSDSIIVKLLLDSNTFKTGLPWFAKLTPLVNKLFSSATALLRIAFTKVPLMLQALTGSDSITTLAPSLTLIVISVPLATACSVLIG